jgi:PAS domain S-box-containing protein
MNEQAPKSEELAKNEERYRFASLATGDAIYDWDIKTNSIWRNHTYKEKFHITDDIEANQEWFLSRLHPKDRVKVEKSLNESLASTDKTWRSEYRLNTGEDEYRFVEDTAYIIRNNKNEPTRIVGKMVDITEKRKGELAVLRLAAIVESSDDAIAGLNLDGKITSWNKGAEKIYGYMASEIIGDHVSLIVPKNKTHEIYDILDKIQKNSRIRHYETYRTRKDGKDIPVSISVSPIIDFEGDLIGTSVITRDISQRKKYLKAIQESEARFRYASLATSDSIYDWNLKTNEVWRNETYQKLFCPGEPIGKDNKWFASKLHPNDRDRVLSSVKEAVKLEKDLWKGAYRFQKIDGEYCYVEDYGFIIHDDEGRPVHIIGAMTDVTERVKSQEMMEIKVKERTAELAGKNRELNVNYETLKRLNDDLDSFVHAASHDLKVPIVNIEALTKIILRDSTLGDKTQEVFEKVLQSVQRVMKTISSLGEATKARKNLYDDIENIKFDAILDEIRDDISEFIKDSKVAIIADFKACKNLNYSRTGLKSILYNFVTNAIKYNSPDRIPKVEIKTSLEGEWVVLSVKDNGLGMNMDKQGKKLFSIFKRLHDHVEGAGVGLYVVKRLVENNGGKIEVDSVLNEGSTFRVYFKQEEK